MRYLLERLENNLSDLDAISTQVAFAFEDIWWKEISSQQMEEIICQEEPRLNIIKVIKQNDKSIVYFYNEELQGEFRRLF